MFKFISVRKTREHRKPVVRPHRTAHDAAIAAKMFGGMWREIAAQPRKNITSGEDCVVYN